MKVLILACLVAFALAKQNDENVFSEEFTTQIIKEKIKELKFEEKQPKEDEHWNKIHPLFQQQPQFNPNVVLPPYSFFPQNFLSFVQHAAMSSYFQQEMENAKAKETSSPNCKAMPFPKPPIAPSFEHQNLNLTDFENKHFFLPLFQSLMQQVPQPMPQIPMFPPQSFLSLAQLKFLPVAQHNMPFAQKYTPVKHYPLNNEFLLYHPQPQFYL